MASKIEWTEKTWNPVIGCTKVSAGCANCYAERMACRQAYMEVKRRDENFDGEGQAPFMTGRYYDVVNLATRKWNSRIKCDEKALDKPLHWRNPRRIFVNSMSDTFHEKVPFSFFDKMFTTMTKCPQHTFQVLTKRPERMKEFLDNYDTHSEFLTWPKPNLWLGVTCENQKAADERIPILLQIPAAVRFVSIEPMLGPVDLRKVNIDLPSRYNGPEQNYKEVDSLEDSYFTDTPFLGSIDWVIVGGESGPGRRECKIEWVRDIVAQCKAANVPVFVKQLDINGKVEKDINKFPKDLQIRQYPGGQK